MRVGLEQVLARRRSRVARVAKAFQLTCQSLQIFWRPHFVVRIHSACQDEKPRKILQSFIAAQLQICPVDERECSLLYVEVDDSLLDLSEEEQFARTEGHLNE